ncbi:MAG: hypothetical protein Q8J78_09495, partial [Moraxellaceae bacterium]|nr:hypothetical protein [Moraxellaceae bacterium]
MSTAWSAWLDTRFPTGLPDLPQAASSAALCPLSGQAILSVAGPEAIQFLQGQVTTDMRETEKGRVLPGAICSLKGRALFTFMAIPVPDGVLLLMPVDQLDAAFAHLKKYSIFSKVTLQADPESYALFGIVAASANVVSPLLRELIPDLPAIGQSVRMADGMVIATLADGRILLAMPSSNLHAFLERIPASIEITTENAWRLSSIRAGLAAVQSDTRDHFQPQELNYPALEGVSYNKGCYTGQEIVARLYFRGKLKQRLYRLEAMTTAPAPGSA